MEADIYTGFCHFTPPFLPVNCTPYPSFLSFDPGRAGRMQLVSYLSTHTKSTNRSMQPDALFSSSNMMALLGWGLLIVLPRWRWTRLVVQSGALSLVFAAIYLILIVKSLPGSDGGFGSLAQVRSLFENDYALLAGWAHYLAFDLFVGSWLLGNAQKFGIRHVLVIPCLLLTFLFGPVGLLTYYVLRAFLRKTFLNGVAYENA